MNKTLLKIDQLAGAKIKSPIQSNPNENGDVFCGFLAILPDKSSRLVWILSDEEGNAPGTIEIERNPQP